MPTDNELEIAVRVLGIICRLAVKLTPSAIKYRLEDEGIYVILSDLQEVLDGLCASKFILKYLTTNSTDPNAKPKIEYGITTEGYSRYQLLEREAFAKKARSNP